MTNHRTLKVNAELSIYVWKRFHNYHENISSPYMVVRFNWHFEGVGGFGGVEGVGGVLVLLSQYK